MRKLRNYREDLLKALQDPQEAEAYLKVAMEEYEQDNDTEAFLVALRNLAEAKGGVTKLAESTHLDKQNLDEILSGNCCPAFDTIGNILHGLGFKLSVESLSPSHHSL